MAYVDAQTLFSDGQDVTSTAASTNYIDQGVAQDLGTGRDVYVVVQCDTTMDDSGDDSTLEVTVETDDNTSFSSATTAQTIGTFAATSAAGTKLIAKLQPEAITERYVRLKYTTANGDLSAGAFTAFLTTDIESYTYYSSGFSIS